MKRPSFLSKFSEDDDYLSDDQGGENATFEGSGPERHAHMQMREQFPSARHSQDDSAGALAVDVYQTSDAIVVKAMIAGVQPNSIDISLTREMLTISGSREDERETEEDSYYQRELYWGTFSRTILLPEEVDVDMAEASEKHGILMIRLPKINKSRETKLKVKTR